MNTKLRSTIREMAALTLIWIVGLGLYFWKTNERQRENHLLVMWALLLVPVIGYPIMRFIGL